jgi:hypothetical protein
MSAYQHAVANGFVGTEAEWLDSLEGGTGPAGPSAVSADDGNIAILGSDDLIYVPESSGGGAVESVAGKTGVVVLEKADVGLGSVDNTADADKPVSTATATALGGKSDTGHTHAQSDVTGLAAALSGKSDTGHTHTASNVTDFDTAADARVVAGITGKLDTSAAPELIRDTIGTALVAGAGTTVTPNDGSDTITIATDANAAVNTVAATGSTETLSAAYQMHKVAMDGACTFTFTSPSAGAVFAVLLSGAFTPTWPASVDWPDGTPPTYTSPSLYVFATFDGGTTWEGVQSGKAFA